ncbi:MAG: DNA polymerase II large subunit, partial [Candidatus Asgardarchaeia archaeon]
MKVEGMKKYFEEIKEGVMEAFEVAGKARKLGIDPSDDVEIIAAEDMAARVEGLVGPKGVADRIRELKKSMEREKIAFEIVREIVEGKFGKFDMEKAADLALRCSLAILTEGITAAPLEGIAEVKIKKNMDGSSYLAVYYAGPIRSAGGTETAQTVLLGDYVRSLLGLDVYKPDKEEIERYVEEVELYERRVTHLQYSVDREEIEFAASHLPIEITGEPTHQYEVSGHRDLPRVETNRIRGGAVLVLVEGVIGRAHKLLKIVDEMGLKGWGWLKELVKIREKKKGSDEEGEKKDKDSILPNSKYLSDVIAGRPVFSHPSAFGGFRLRYGRSRDTGLAAAGLNPATMYILDEFIAVGTHIRMERPGKGAIITPVTTIEGPVVKLKDGSVVRVNDVKTAKAVRGNVERILFLGDILVAYGEFLENNHPLVPSSYVEEWWAEDLRRSIEDMFDGILSRASNLLGIEEDKLRGWMEEPLKFYPTPEEAVSISLKLGIPLHPRYTYFWSRINLKDFVYFLSRVSESCPDYDHGKSLKVRYDERLKEIMEEICLPHRMRDGYIELSKEDSYVIYSMLKSMRSLSKDGEFDGDVLDFINEYCSVKVKKKGATFIGARMGRPEKAKERKMKPPVHILFPTGGGGGRIRDFAKLKDKGKVKTEVKTYYCDSCGEVTFSRVCPFCGRKTRTVRVCPNCGGIYRKDRERCPRCGTPLHDYSEIPIDMNRIWKVVSKRIRPPIPKSVKGVIKLMSGGRVPEPLEKGFIRAKYGLFVNKDGTIRFDSTDAPLTHFKPKEIGTPVEKLRELGYTHDYEGDELEDDEQVLELKVQDVILPMSAGKYLLKVSNFVDETLETLYGLDPFYKAESVEDLTGHLIVGLAPHISAGIIGRIIGFTRASVCYAHPYWHAAKRRNCLVGDEDLILVDRKDNVKIIKMRDVERIDIDDHFVFSVSDDGKIVKRRIKGFVKLKSPDYLYRIITDTGRMIEVTPDHRMLVLEGGKIRLVEAKDLREGDRLLALSKFEGKGMRELNLLRYYSTKKNDGIIVHRVKGNAIDAMMMDGMGYRESGPSGSSVQYEKFQNCLEGDSIPLNVFYKISYEDKIPTEEFYISYEGDRSRLPAILNLSRELGFLVGFHLASGYSMREVGDSG